MLFLWWYIYLIMLITSALSQITGRWRSYTSKKFINPFPKARLSFRLLQTIPPAHINPLPKRSFDTSFSVPHKPKSYPSTTTKLFQTKFPFLFGRRNNFFHIASTSSTPATLSTSGTLMDTNNNCNLEKPVTKIFVPATPNEHVRLIFSVEEKVGILAQVSSTI
jgi:hypothetical protein